MGSTERPTRAGSGGQGGFTYIALLILIAIISAALAATADVWHTTVQRDREADLLFVGGEFRTALARYYAANRRYPMRLDDLVLDNYSLAVRRHLRKIYVDPMTGKTEWGLTTLADGQIIGVHSLSDDTPIKQAGFQKRDAAFEGKTRYSDWVFTNVAATSGTQTTPLPSSATQMTPGTTSSSLLGGQ